MVSSTRTDRQRGGSSAVRLPWYRRRVYSTFTVDHGDGGEVSSILLLVSSVPFRSQHNRTHQFEKTKKRNRIKIDEPWYAYCSGNGKNAADLNNNDNNNNQEFDSPRLDLTSTSESQSILYSIQFLLYLFIYRYWYGLCSRELATSVPSLQSLSCKIWRAVPVDNHCFHGNPSTKLCGVYF